MAGLRLSGINSGFDTEAMIREMMYVYQSKIDKQNQKLQKLQWQQEQYRDITSKLSTFKNKYFDILKRDSYLLSPSSYTQFKANIVTKSGKTSGLKVTTSASASAGSHKIKVDQLATAAETKGGQVSAQNFKLDVDRAMKTVDPDEKTGEYTFSLDVKVGNVAKTITFSGEDKDHLLYSLNEGLKDAFGTTAGGEAFISASMNDAGEFVFKTTGNAMATVTERFGDFGMTTPSKMLQVTTSSALTGTSSVAVTVNDPETGEPITKRVDFKTVTDMYFDGHEDDEDLNAQFLALKQSAFYKKTGIPPFLASEEMMDSYGFRYTSVDAAADLNAQSMISALNEAYADENIKFAYNSTYSYISATYEDGKSAEISMTSLGDATLGLKKGTATSYLNENTKLSDLGIEMNVTRPTTVTKTRTATRTVTKPVVDEDGNEVLEEDGTPKTEEVEEEYEEEYEEEVIVGVGYMFTINGENIKVGENATVADLMNAVNSSNAGVTMTYSKLEGSFTITANDKGTGGDIRIDDDNPIAQALGLTSDTIASHKDGVNSVFTIDGVQVEHNDNVYELDGVTYDFSEVVPADGEEFTVNLSKDYTTIKQAIKDFVNDYNQLLDDIYGYTKTARPKDSSTKSYYEPLTDEQKEEMSEKEIERWEEKAKTGLLYNDSTVNAIMSKMRLALYNTIELDDGSTFGLFNMGIKTAGYLDDDEEAARYGKLKFDEDAFEAAFENNVDAIEKLFTDTTNGVMTKVRDVIDSAIQDTSTSKGSLVRKAGLTTGTSAKDNAIYNEMKRITDRIELLQKRYDNKEEYWWKVFTNLEKMQAQFNSQQSYLEMFIANGGYFAQD